MRFAISGTEYAIDALNRASMLDLIELKRQTGLTMADLQQMTEVLEGQDVTSPEAFMGNETFLMLMAVIIWLSRRKAGERSLRFEDSADVALVDFRWIADDEPAVEAEAAPDPA